MLPSMQYTTCIGGHVFIALFADALLHPDFAQHSLLSALYFGTSPGVQLCTHAHGLLTTTTIPLRCLIWPFFYIYTSNTTCTLRWRSLDFFLIGLRRLVDTTWADETAYGGWEQASHGIKRYLQWRGGIRLKLRDTNGTA